MIRKDQATRTYTKTVNEAQGLVETIFSVTGVKDRQGDILVPGSFTKALQGKKPTVVFSHSWTDIGQVLGHVKDWAELMPGDTRLPADVYNAGYGGAWACVKFNLGVEAGRTAFELVRNGDLQEWSWAFDIDDGGHEYDSKLDARRIKSVKEIFELTLCVVGANQLTRTVSAKTPAAMFGDPEWYATMPAAARKPGMSVFARLKTAAAVDKAIEDSAIEQVVADALARDAAASTPNFDHFLSDQKADGDPYAHFLLPRPKLDD